MGWVGDKWFPRWPGDCCTGWYHPPDDGSAPVWERRDPGFEGTQDRRPVWVMANGREVPAEEIARKSGGPDCKVRRYGKHPPHGRPFASHVCCSHGTDVVYLYGEADVLSHLKGNKSLFGQLAKEGVVEPLGKEAPEAKPEVAVPAPLAAEIRAFLGPLVASNGKFVELWKAGKTGPLVGAAMREAKGKYEGRHVEAVLGEMVG